MEGKSWEGKIVYRNGYREVSSLDTGRPGEPTKEARADPGGEGNSERTDIVVFCVVRANNEFQLAFTKYSSLCNGSSRLGGL